MVNVQQFQKPFKSRQITKGKGGHLTIEKESLAISFLHTYHKQKHFISM